MSAPAWPTTPADAIALQEQLRHQVITTDDLGAVSLMAGVDVGFEDDGAVTRAAVVVLDAATLAVVASAVAHEPTRFPYVPGLLAFREVPAIMAALAQLVTPPDLVLCDGQGLIHPRRFGLACHLGVLTGLATIGVGKTPFIGQHAAVADERGAWAPIIHHGETIGAALRTRAGTQPIYVSVGHRVSLDTAISWVLRCAPRFRLPETTRQAHHLASNLK